MRRKLQRPSRNGTMCGAIWHWLQMQQHLCWWDMTVCEMTASEMEQSLGNFSGEITEYGDSDSADFSGTACSRILRIWTASALVDRSCSQGFKKQGRDPLQRLGSQCSANEVRKFCYIGKLQPGNEHFKELRQRLQNFLESTAQLHKGQSGSVALAVKLEIKRVAMRGKCFGHFGKDCKMQQLWW